MKLNKKKGVEQSVAVIITIALLLIFLFIYGMFWKGAFGKGSGALNNQIDLTKNSGGDNDGDGIVNFEDNCPCCTGCSKGTIDKGCPNSPTTDQKTRKCIT